MPSVDSNAGDDSLMGLFGDETESALPVDKCTHTTQRCPHAMYAYTTLPPACYTGVPCAAFSKFQNFFFKFQFLILIIIFIFSSIPQTPQAHHEWCQQIDGKRTNHPAQTEHQQQQQQPEEHHQEQQLKLEEISLYNHILLSMLSSIIILLFRVRSTPCFCFLLLLQITTIGKKKC